MNHPACSGMTPLIANFLWIAAIVIIVLLVLDLIETTLVHRREILLDEALRRRGIDLGPGGPRTGRQV